MTCLAVDVGNTSTALGIVSGTRVSQVHHIEGGLRDLKVVRDALAHMSLNRIDGAVVGSVVPQDVPLWNKTIKQLVGAPPLIVDHTLAMDVDVAYPAPETIGADRLANACGAVLCWGAPAIVADFGTALTFDVIDSNAAYIGGVIAPGLPLMTTYLAERTALLPLIDLRGRCHAVGRSTEGAMRIGARIGYRGMVKEIVSYLTDTNDLEGSVLVATGGYAKWALRGSDMPFHFAPQLTLVGLGRIFELNTSQGTG